MIDDPIGWYINQDHFVCFIGFPIIYFDQLHWDYVKKSGDKIEKQYSKYSKYTTTLCSGWRTRLWSSNEGPNPIQSRPLWKCYEHLSSTFKLVGSTGYRLKNIFCRGEYNIEQDSHRRADLNGEPYSYNVIFSDKASVFNARLHECKYGVCEPPLSRPSKSAQSSVLSASSAHFGHQDRYHLIGL